MTPELLESPLFLAAAALGTLGAIFVLLGIAALLRLKPLGFALRTLVGLLLLALGALAGTIAVGIQGYRALTREDLAAKILVKPAGAQRFTATFEFPDGRKATYALAGDEIYVDAHILKWHPYANWAGLHTAYELDRVTGRYHSIQEERAAQRTVHALGRDRPVDLFALRRRYTFLAPLLDAEYGSATFVSADRPAALELRVSTTGLLIREPKPPQKK
ncbi:MAG: hypothetical protein HYY78_12670 [Betaproteobacteria bacterium]|nr:hypothetical protein [Betaproteobacteria bacterium]